MTMVNGEKESSKRCPSCDGGGLIGIYDCMSCGGTGIVEGDREQRLLTSADEVGSEPLAA